MINGSKPTTSLTNTAQPDKGITWATISTTWSTETETWGEVSTLFTNAVTGATGLLWSIKRFPWTELTPWLSEGGITNTNKPA